jgi:DNA-binding NtrC family response regulator
MPRTRTPRTLSSGERPCRDIETLLMGRSAAMQALRCQLQALAPTLADVLIVGETGTGKELVARCLHQLSLRQARPLVAINCGGLPATLVDSELFGHESGAFTSAHKRRIGRIEQADGGTLLLDEIESMPMVIQTKLLRVLQERSVERLGSNQALPLDLRVVAASKVDLKAMSVAGEFRSDLYYRLNVAVIRLPALRDRLDDIPLLFDHFARQAAQRFRVPVPEISGATIAGLMAQDWPGNVRELRNAADRFVLGLGGDPGAVDKAASLACHPLAAQIAHVEKVLIEQALKRHQGRIGDAMQSLGLCRQILDEKLRQHGIDPDRYGPVACPSPDLLARPVSSASA